jgi:hypothetical protein
MRSKLLLVFSILLFGIFLIENVSATTYHISDCNGLNNVRNDLTGNYILDQNLNCGGIAPIGGNGAADFTGSFDGQGFYISGLSISSSAMYVGLFGQAQNALIKNLGLSGITVLSSSGSSYSYTGSLLGSSDGNVNIQNVWATGTVTFNNLVDSDCVGGLIGYGNVIVSNSYSKVTVTTNGESWVCRGSGGTCKVGGFIGKVAGGTSSFANCYSNGAVATIAGYRGGFAGAVKDTTSFTNCYSTGQVGYGDSFWGYQGGFVAYTEGTFSNTNSFYDSQTSLQSSDGGSTTQRTTTQMKTLSNYPWNINTPTSIWDIKQPDAQDYPRLWMEYSPVFSSGTAASPVKINTAFTVTCNYGKQLPSQCIGATHNGVNCAFQSWSGATSTANIQCTAASTTGLKLNTCNINYYAPDVRCHTALSNSISATNVVQCFANSDCNGLPGTPVCNVATGNCVNCNSATDCSDVACKSKSCVSNTCQYTPTPGAACSDGNLCTNDVCDGSGSCIGTLKCNINQICDSSEGVCYDKRSCSPDDTIMNLFKPVNSKGSIWSIANNWSVCYSDIFGGSIVTPNVHNCNGVNKVLWLSDTDNANAQFSQDGSHNTPVCYGDLNCTIIDDTGLIAYYPLETNANDSSGNGNNGVNNGATFTSGRVGQAGSFNGASYIITPDIKNSFGSETITIAVLFKANSAGVIVSELGQSTINTAWHDSQMEILSTGEVKVRVWNVASVSLGTVNFGTWNHVVLRYNKATSSFDGFLNGVLSAPVSGNRDAPWEYGNGQFYAFGATDSSSLGGGKYFNGLIDEVKIWNRSLSAGEVLNEYNNADAKTVARLNQNTNSYISNGSSYIGFPYKISCKTQGVSYWADMMGKPINSTNVGSNVKLVVNKLGLTGKNINFSIYDNLTKAFKWSDTETAQFPNSAFTVWTAQAGGFYFTANISTGDNLISTENLSVKATPFNDIPTTQITRPLKGANYLINEPINFSQSSYDMDDDLRIIWDFGDGNTTSFDNIFSFGLGNTTHSYSSTGTKSILLTAQEMTRSQSAKNSSVIYLHNQGLNVFAKIDSPIYSGVVSEGFYNVGGQSSYVENCSLSCPSGKTCISVQSIINPGVNLFCYQFADSSQLNFTWIFDNQVIDLIKNNSNFSWNFDGPKIHLIKLIVNFSSSGVNIGDSSSTTLIVSSSNLTCSGDGLSWINGSNPLNLILTSTANKCYNLSANPKTCCPGGYSCSQSTPGNYFCNYTGFNYCWDIKTSGACSDATSVTSKNSALFLGKSCANSAAWIESGKTCYNKSVCGCAWNGNNCTLNSQRSKICSPGISVSQPACDFVPVSWDDRCEDSGVIIVQVHASGSTDPDCVDQTKTVPCEQVTQLDFFDNWNFIEAIIMLIIIYGFYIRGNRYA